MYQIRPYSWKEPILNGFKTKEEAKAEIVNISKEGLWYEDVFYFPNWIKRIEIEEEVAKVT